MATLAARFSALKQKVSGNREKKGYEYTFGATPMEKAFISPLSKDNNRILSELNFSLELNRVNNNKFEKEIDKALSLLEAAIAEDGVLTKANCMLAEKELMPLAQSAKEYEVIFAGHAHIDMNWQWGLQETVGAALSTFRTMLDLMNEYPEFTFMQSQGSVYKIVEKYDPAMMDEIKRRIKEGRWEVTASAWVETDKNMPDTESLIHHITVTREYLKNTWGVDPDSVKVDFSPDTFGHSRFIPEINDTFGVKYYYHCRGLEEIETLYKYKAPSGTEILCYKEPYWYNSAVLPDAGTGVIGLSERCAGLKTGLVVYGVGDHGGGVTRRDIEHVLEMQNWPVFPVMKFGTLHEYFAKAEAVRDKVTVIDHELNAILTGCYTTQSRIKLGNRRSEVSINDASKMCALGSRVLPVEYPKDRFNAAWEDILFTHFHDILTGSCVQESREHAMGLFADALSYTQTAQANALRVIAGNVDTSAFKTDEDLSETQSYGAGVGYGFTNYTLYGYTGGNYYGIPNPERGAGKSRPYTVFNTSSAEREDVVTITVWDITADLNNLEVVDQNGNKLWFDLLDREPQWYWDHRYVRLLVQVKVPAMGYTTLCIREAEISSYPTYYLDDIRVDAPLNDITLENDYIKAEFSGANGMLLSLTDKATGTEALEKPAGLILCMAEKKTNDAWHIGRILKEIPVDDALQITPPQPGNKVQTITLKHKVMSSFVNCTISLAPCDKELHYDFDIDWNEASFHSDLVPVLRFNVPVKGGAETMTNDVPAGYAVRTAKGQDAAGLTYAIANGSVAKPAIITDCKYGYRLHRNILSVSLINSAYSPDPYPERGMHKINLWLTPKSLCPVALKKRTEQLMRPLIAMPTMAKEGKLPGEMSLMTFESNTSILSSVEKNDCGKTAIRVYEMAGKDDTVTLTFPENITEINGAEGNVCGNKATFNVGAYKIVTVYVK